MMHIGCVYGLVVRLVRVRSRALLGVVRCASVFSGAVARSRAVGRSHGALTCFEWRLRRVCHLCTWSSGLRRLQDEAPFRFRPLVAM